MPELWLRDLNLSYCDHAAHDPILYRYNPHRPGCPLCAALAQVQTLTVTTRERMP